MPNLNLASDLLEVRFTPEELNLAQQFKAPDLTRMLMQNTRVGIFRQIVSLKFDKSEADEDNRRVHAYLSGQLDILQALIDGCDNPTPVPINPDGSVSSTPPSTTL